MLSDFRPSHMRYILLFVLLVLSFYGNAQLVYGTVSDEEGNPLPYASVYLENTSFGVATNQKGAFQINLKEGTHDLVFSFIGYEKLVRRVNVSSEKTEFNVRLKSASNELLTAEIVGDTKDRAKAIMDKARVARKEIKDRLSTYECQAYMKMSIEREFPDTTLNPLENPDAEVKLSKQNLILSESFGTLYYKKQSRYKEFISAQRDNEAKKVPNLGKSMTVSFNLERDHIAPLPTFPSTFSLPSLMV